MFIVPGPPKLNRSSARAQLVDALPIKCILESTDRAENILCIICDASCCQYFQGLPTCYFGDRSAYIHISY